MSDDDDVMIIDDGDKPATKRSHSLASVGSVKGGKISSPLDDLPTKSPKELADSRKDEGNKKYKDGHYEAAIKCYSEAIDLYKDSVYFCNRSQTYIRMNKISEGLEDAQMAVRMDPEYPKAHAKILRCYLLQGKEDIIPTYVEKLSQENRQSKELIREVEFVKDIQQLKKNIESNEAKGDWKAVAYFCGKLVENCPSMNPPIYQLKRVEALVYAGKIQEALDSLLDILRKDSSNVEAIFARGLIFMYQDQLDKAYDTFRHALKLMPDHGKSMTYLKKVKTIKGNKELAASHVSQNRDKDALDIYSKTLEIEPLAGAVNAKLYFNQSICYTKLGQPIPALTACEKAVSLDKNYVKARMKRVQLLIDNDKHEEAFREAESLFKSHQNTPGVNTLYDEARSALKRSKTKDYYKILGVSRNCSEDDIKKAYKKKAMVHHPDRHSNATEEEKKSHEQMFKDVGEAFGILSDKTKRTRYDNGQDPHTGGINTGPGAEYAFDPNEIFATFFGGGMGGGGGPFMFSAGGGGRSGRGHRGHGGQHFGGFGF